MCLQKAVVQANPTLAQNVQDLLDNVNWSFVSLPSLIDAVARFPVLRGSPTFRQLFADEMMRRSETSKDMLRTL